MRFILNNLKKLLSNSKVEHAKVKHQLDKSGKSKVDQTHFKINPAGHVMLECYDWSKKLEKEYADKLSLSISTDEFMNWITHKAY